jgi:hypothetical protein
MNNPFILSVSASGVNFVGRAREIRRIVSRVAGGGQSVAITGEPRIGKTTLLRYLYNPDRQAELFGDLAPHLLTQYIDVQTFGPTFDQGQFWQIALQPLAEKLIESSQSTLCAAYDTCKSEGFSVFNIERLLAQMQLLGWRLVILLDEFDNLLNHPTLHQAEFYGGLRSLASRYESLALVTASRQPLEILNETTREYSKLGSPYFNFMTPVVLGMLEKKDVLQLLKAGEAHFSLQDYEFIYSNAGGHPYLLKIAASGLWDAYEDSETDSLLRWEIAARELLYAAHPVLSDTWRLWTIETRKAIITIALDTIPGLVSNKEFDIDSLLKSFADYIPEVDELRKRGFLVQDTGMRTGYRLQAQIMLWWLASELFRSFRSQNDNDLGDWLRTQEWDGIIKGEEKAQLKKALTSLGGLHKNGVESFIKASAESFAKGLTGVK